MADLSQAEPKVLYTSKEVLDGNIPRAYEPPEPKTCKYCGKTLYHEGLMFGGKIIVWHTNEPQRCDCSNAKIYWQKHDALEQEKRKQEEEAERNRQMREKVERLMGNSGIRKRFINRTFENFVVDENNKAAYTAAKRYADNFNEYAERGQGIYFEGTYGTGKTHLAVAISLQLIKQGVPVICKTSIDILGDIKRAYDTRYQYTEEEVLKIYKRAKLLVIDDLGKEQCTEWTMPILYSIINERYESMLPTIITTNYNEDMLIRRLTPKGLDSSNAEAIVSRLHECTDVVTMAWSDYRDYKVTVPVNPSYDLEAAQRDIDNFNPKF